jgi:hypothetical protein
MTRFFSTYKKKHNKRQKKRTLKRGGGGGGGGSLILDNKNKSTLVSNMSTIQTNINNVNELLQKNIDIITKLKSPSLKHKAVISPLKHKAVIAPPKKVKHRRTNSSLRETSASMKKTPASSPWNIIPTPPEIRKKNKKIEVDQLKADLLKIKKKQNSSTLMPKEDKPPTGDVLSENDDEYDDDDSQENENYLNLLKEEVSSI